MNQERKLQIAQQSRLTNLMWEAFKPFLKARKDAADVLLVQGFRAGKRPDELYPHIAELSVISGIENEIQHIIKRGEHAATEELNGKNDN